MAGKLCGALKLLEEGKEGIVVAVAGLWSDLEAARKAVQAAAQPLGAGRKLDRQSMGISRVRAYMATAVASGFQLLIQTGKLVPEGKHKSGQPGIPEMSVYAFKHDQYRCYGGYLSYGHRRCFVCVEADESKKQNKADLALLQRVAAKLGQLTAESKMHPLAKGETWPSESAT